MQISKAEYELYVYLSYLPRWAEASLDWLNCDFEYEFGDGISEESWWVDEGVKALKRTMEEEIATTENNAVHVIPLSGGFDSRAIFGGLIDNIPGSQIVAVTYGIPGAWDFEIAKSITKKYGIRHELIDLTKEKWDVDELTKSASHLKYPVSVHQFYIRQKINKYFGTDCVYWSGFMGDSLAGSYLPKTPNVDRKSAVKRFINTAPTPNYKSQQFQDKLVDNMVELCPWDRLFNKKFTLDQQIDIGVRQKFLHRPIVVIDGYHFKTPFLTPTWGNYITNVPYKWLLDFYLYQRIILKAYKVLAKFPTRGNAGMPVSASNMQILVGKAIARVKPYFNSFDPYHSHPRTNYINWTEALRHKGNFQESVYSTLLELRKRNIFENKNLDRWWNDHLSRKMDYTILLTNLSSLELLIRAGLM